MSEAELHVLRQRMYQGRLNKARRGELYMPPADRLRQVCRRVSFALDPDEQVQAVVRLVFEKFEQLGTLDAACCATWPATASACPSVRTAARDRGQLRVAPAQPRRRLQQRPASTRSTPGPTPRAGGRSTRGGRSRDGRRRGGWSRRRRTARCCCRTASRPTSPGSGTSANQRRLEENRTPAACRGAPGGAVAAGGAGDVRAVRPRPCACSIPARADAATLLLLHATTPRTPARLCQSVCGPRGLDEAGRAAGAGGAGAGGAGVERWRRPTTWTRSGERLDVHWRQRLERARYEAERAARQYHAVEPENRLVARELERRVGSRPKRTNSPAAGVRPAKPGAAAGLSAEEREAILALSHNLPAVWSAASTSPATGNGSCACCSNAWWCGRLTGPSAAM